LKINTGTSHQIPEIVQIAIKDNGKGFPEGFPIFEPFYSTDPNSTGLGLATVKELIEEHGGTIKAVPGEGATIEIEIPYHERNQS
jgi:two-component system nitrogen regulation sensor histidine kinase NtrY